MTLRVCYSRGVNPGAVGGVTTPRFLGGGRGYTGVSMKSKHIFVYSDSVRNSRTLLIRQICTRWWSDGEGIRRRPVRGRRHLSEGRGIPQSEALPEKHALIRTRGRERKGGRKGEGRREERAGREEGIAGEGKWGERRELDGREYEWEG